MGLILDIVDKVVPRVQARVAKGKSLRRSLYEELEKEIAHYSTDQSKSYEHLKNNIKDILTDKVDLDNYGVYDKDGQTLRGVDEI